MGGSHEQMVVKPLHAGDNLKAMLSRFAAAEADCYLASDRGKLCARRGDRHNPPAQPRCAPMTRPDGR